MMMKAIRIGSEQRKRHVTHRFTSFFLEFDEEKVFIKAPDPDTEALQRIHQLIKGKVLQNQTQIFDLVKSALGITSKETFTKLLGKGVGVYWMPQKAETGRAVLYRPIVSPNSSRDNETIRPIRQRLRVVKHDR